MVEFKIDSSNLFYILGFFLILIALSWYRFDSRRALGARKNAPEELLTQFIKSVGKVGLLMLGILFIGVPLTALIIKSGTEIQNGMQFFNGFSAVVFGLAIAAAGAWVSIKLAHVATEIASNHFYSEESSKRYNEAKSAAELVHRLDFAITNLSINAIDFADRVKNYESTKNQENQEKQEQQLKQNLKSLALLALDYSKLYQHALQTPVLLEAIHSEYVLTNKIQDRVSGKKANAVIHSNEFDVFDWISSFKTDDSHFLYRHFFNLRKCFKELLLDDENSNSCGKDDIFKNLKYFSENIHRNAISLSFSIDSNLTIPLSNLASEISKIRSNAYQQYKDVHGSLPNTFLEKRQIDITIAFYILDYIFTHGTRHDGIQIDINSYDPSEKKATRKEASKEVRDYSDTLDNRVNSILNTEVEGKIKSLKIKEISGDSNFVLNKQSQRVIQSFSSGEKLQRTKPVKSESNNFLDDSQNVVTKSEPKQKSESIDVSAHYFASANYVIPRMPRELLSVKFCKNDEASNAELRFEAIKQLYAGENGIHILKTGRAAGQHSNEKDLQAIELQLYVFRTLSTSIEVGNDIIYPFVRVGRNKCELENEFSKIGEKIQLVPFTFREM